MNDYTKMMIHMVKIRLDQVAFLLFICFFFFFFHV
jgi:hypothetical protein